MYAGNQIPPDQALQRWQDPNNLQRMFGEQERKVKMERSERARK